MSNERESFKRESFGVTGRDFDDVRQDFFNVFHDLRNMGITENMTENMTEEQKRIAKKTAAGMNYFAAYWDAYGGNGDGPLSQEVGARLLFVHGLANIWSRNQKGVKDDPISPASLQNLEARIKAWDSNCGLFGVNAISSEIIQNALAADFALSGIDYAVTTVYNTYNFCLVGLAAFAGTALNAAKAARKNAHISFETEHKLVINLCDTLIHAHKYISLGQTILYTVCEYYEVNAPLYEDLDWRWGMIDAIFDILTNIANSPNITEPSRTFIGIVALKLNQVCRDFSLPSKIDASVRERVKENHFEFTRYLANGFISVLEKEFEKDLNECYENRKPGNGFSNFLKRT